MVVTPVSRFWASLGSAVQVRIGTLGASFASLIYMHLVYTTKYSPCYNCVYYPFLVSGFSGTQLRVPERQDARALITHKVLFRLGVPRGGGVSSRPRVRRVSAIFFSLSLGILSGRATILIR